MTDPFVFTRLHLPRPISPEAVQLFIRRLSATDVPRPLSFEVRAGDDGIQHILGCSPTAVWSLKHLLSGSIPGIIYEGVLREPMVSAGRIEAHQNGLPTGTPDPEHLVHAIYTALDGRKKGETLVLQVVLGRARHPASVRSDAPDPLQPMASRLWNGVRKAAPETRRRLQEHAADVRLGVTVRLGVLGPDEARRKANVHHLFGSLQALQSVGVTLRLTREASTNLHFASPLRPGLHLTPSELAPLLGWPLGERDYPGLDRLHPKRLAVAKDVSSTEAVFAVSTAPGPERPVGFDPAGRLQHSVAIGPTGSGKSVLLEHLILSDIAAGRACIVVEPKRQLVDSILSHVPASVAGQIVVLDAADESPVGFNPLDLGPDDDPYVVADNILAALAAIFEDGWGPRTEYLIQGALVTLLLAGSERREPFTLIDLPLLLTDAKLRKEATANVTGDPMLASFWAEYEEMNPRQRTAQIAAPLNKLRKLVMRKNLVAVLGQSRPGFRLRDIFREGKTVLVPLNEALLGKGAAKLLGSLIIAEIWTATLKRATEQNPRQQPGMVFVDEVQNYLHLPTDVGDAMATSRSYGVAWHVAHQYRAQLPSTMRAGFDTNARSKFVFALGPDDARDLAKHAPNLTAPDFQGLGQYEIYGRLMVGGAQTDWFSARTLPPPRELGAAEIIRAVSREQYGPRQKPVAESAPSTPTAVDQGASAPPKRPAGQKARRT